MSLLDQLAKNTCSIGFSLEQFTPTLSIESIVSEASEREETRSNHNSSYELIATTVVSPQKKVHLPNGPAFDDMSWGCQSRYIEKYRDKYSKISAIVSLLSAKTRKAKFQFMVHLQRWCQQKQKQVNLSSVPLQNDGISPQKSIVSKENELIFFSNLQQMIAIIKRRQKEALQKSFKAINKKVRSCMKIDYADKVVKGIRQKVRSKLIRTAFICINEYVKIAPKVAITTGVSKMISFPKNLENPKIKTQLIAQAIQLAHVDELRQPSKLMPVFPQTKDQQSIDFYDTINLFMEKQGDYAQFTSSKGSGFFDINSCVSAFDSRKSSSPRSYHKMFSEIQLTAVPQSAMERRRVSDFVSSVDDRAPSDFSQVEERRRIDSNINPTKSEVTFEKQIYSRFEVFNEKYEREDEIKDFSDVFMRKEEYRERRFSGPDQVVRSKSEVKVYQSQRPSLVKQEDIEQSYKEDMNRYIKFKKSLEQRRNTTLKQIEKSQDTIKKLMLKFKKQKQKNKSLKVTLRLDKSKQGSVNGKTKKSHNSSSKATPTKYKPSESGMKASTQKKTDRNIYGSFIQKEKDEVSQGKNTEDKMDIFCNYVKERRKMNSAKGSPSKKKPMLVTEQSSGKKNDKKMVQSSAHKNLLAISNFPLGKEQRVSLKVDLLKQKQKKAEGGLHSNKKQKKCRHNIHSNVEVNKRQSKK